MEIPDITDRNVNEASWAAYFKALELGIKDDDAALWNGIKTVVHTAIVKYLEEEKKHGGS